MNINRNHRIFISGCSSGIGRALLDHFLTTGNTCFALVRQASDLKNLLHFENLFPIEVDLANNQGLKKAMLASGITEKAIDLVIHNAGYAQAGPILELENQQLLSQFQVNLFSTNTINRVLLPAMHSKTKIILLGSVLGYAPATGRSAYSMSKFALESYADTLREELKSIGVFVTLVQPGPVRTKFNERLLDSLSEIQGSRRHNQFDEIRNKLFTRYSSPPRKSSVSSEYCAKKIIAVANSTRPPNRIRVTLPATLAWYLRRLLPMSIFARLTSGI